MKKTIVEPIHHIQLDLIEGDIDSFISELKAIKEKYISQYINLSLDTIYDEDMGCTYIVVLGKRFETDQEEKKRLRLRAKRKIEKERKLQTHRQYIEKQAKKLGLIE